MRRRLLPRLTALRRYSRLADGDISLMPTARCFKTLFPASAAVRIADAQSTLAHIFFLAQAPAGTGADRFGRRARPTPAPRAMPRAAASRAGHSGCLSCAVASMISRCLPDYGEQSMGTQPPPPGDRRFHFLTPLYFKMLLAPAMPPYFCRRCHGRKNTLSLITLIYYYYERPEYFGCRHDVFSMPASATPRAISRALGRCHGSDDGGLMGDACCYAPLEKRRCF